MTYSPYELGHTAGMLDYADMNSRLCPYPPNSSETYDWQLGWADGWDDAQAQDSSLAHYL